MSMNQLHDLTSALLAVLACAGLLLAGCTAGDAPRVIHGATPPAPLGPTWTIKPPPSAGATAATASPEPSPAPERRSPDYMTIPDPGYITKANHLYQGYCTEHGDLTNACQVRSAVAGAVEAHLARHHAGQVPPAFVNRLQ